MIRERRRRCAIEPSFSSRFASELISYAADLGADGASLAAMTGLAPRAMNREDVRIPCSTMARIWEAAMDQTGEPHLAMRLGTERLLGANRTTSLIMESSGTVLESFRLAAQYSVLVADVLDVEVIEIGQDVVIEFRATPEWRREPERVQLDCLAITYSSAVASLKQMLGTEQPPTVLTLAAAAPSDRRRWDDVFGAGVQFGAPANRIGFPRELTARSLATNDPGLNAVLRKYADEVADGFAGEPRLTNTVMQAIARMMDPEPPSLEQVAASLGLSARSLQRRLKVEGHGYRSIAERVRIDLSKRYLSEPDRTIDQVARLVGYADTSSFVRAFKRSVGVPPGRFAQGRRTG